MMGFASNKSVADEPFLVPRKLALGNFSMLGVMLSYMDDSMITGLKSAMGWNFPPRSLGEEIQSSLMKLYRNGAIKAVVGKAISFEEIPQAIADMAASKTMGRVVAVL
jgi:NADPH:quinone reductase-like Zn-dependent oxidoreductase